MSCIAVEQSLAFKNFSCQPIRLPKPYRLCGEPSSNVALWLLFCVALQSPCSLFCRLEITAVTRPGAENALCIRSITTKRIYAAWICAFDLSNSPCGNNSDQHRHDGGNSTRLLWHCPCLMAPSGQHASHYVSEGTFSDAFCSEPPSAGYAQRSAQQQQDTRARLCRDTHRGSCQRQRLRRRRL